MSIIKTKYNYEKTFLLIPPHPAAPDGQCV